MKARDVLIMLMLLMMGTLFVACAPNSVVNPASFSQMSQQAKTYSQQEYVIVPGDSLDIKFMHYPELNELAMPVRPDGRISLQLASEVMAAGLTPNQLKEVLVKKYQSELKTPEITVIVRTISYPKVLVDGEVAAPGLVDIKGPLTVMTAIGQAKGLKETARLSSVIVIRKESPQAQPMATMVDLRGVIDGTDFSQDINLMPYDIVYVPKSNIARVNKFVNEYINGIVPYGFVGPFLAWYAISNTNH